MFDLSFTKITGSLGRSQGQFLARCKQLIGKGHSLLTGQRFCNVLRSFMAKPVRLPNFAQQQVLQEVRVTPVSSKPELARIHRLLQEHHYLGSLKPVGERLYYVATAPTGQWLAVLVFSSASHHLKLRDRWIGWTRKRAPGRPKERRRTFPAKFSTRLSHRRTLSSGGRKTHRGNRSRSCKPADNPLRRTISPWTLSP